MIGISQESAKKISELGLTAEQIWQRLGPLLTDERRAKIERVSAQRSREVACVLENPFDRGNVSAVMRSIESMGYESLHLIHHPSKQRMKESQRTTAGADKWLQLHKWDSTTQCLQHLKAKGHRVLATSLEPGSRSIFEVDLQGPLAIVFGNEKDGITKEVAGLADHLVWLPMYGMTQSFNISVAAALSLWTIRTSREHQGVEKKLSPEELLQLRAEYAIATLDSAFEILSRV